MSDRNTVFVLLNLFVKLDLLKKSLIVFCDLPVSVDISQ